MHIEQVDLKKATIIDVREPFECEMGMVEGSINIPMGDVPNRINDLIAMKKPLVLCCASGNRSGQVAQFLTANGVEGVYNGGGWNTIALQMED